MTFPHLEAVRATLDEGLESKLFTIHDVVRGTQSLTAPWVRSVQKMHAKDPAYTRICELIAWFRADAERAILFEKHCNDWA